MVARSTVRSSPDVVVVGAGLAGLPVAWELLRRGLSVTVLDRGRPEEQTSRVAAGMLAPITEVEPDDPDHLTLGSAARHRWPAFASELRMRSGHAVPVRSQGTLAIARDRDEAEALDRFHAVCTRFGLAVERLVPSAARRIEPALAPTLRGALQIPDDHAVDPRQVVAALAAAVTAAGGQVRSATEVRRLTVEDGRVTGVELEDGVRIAAETVVLAGGAETPRLDGIPDEARIPQRPVKGQLLVLRDPSGPGLVEHTLRFGRGYLVPRDDGRYILGATTEERGFDRSVTAWAVHDLLRDGAELVPGILDLQLEETLAGLRPTTPDGLPAIGRSAQVEGLWWSTGHYRNGVLFAPVTGPLLADAMLGPAADDRSSDLEALVDPGRFGLGS